VVVTPPPPLPEKIATASTLFDGLENYACGMETLQSKAEQKLIEASGGSCKGLSDDVKFHIHQSRLLEWQLSEIRYQVTAELRQMKTGLEHKLQKAFSANRMANSCLEQQLKRLILMQEMDVAKSWQHLNNRMSVLEDMHASMTKDVRSKSEDMKEIRQQLRAQEERPRRTRKSSKVKEQEHLDQVQSSELDRELDLFDQHIHENSLWKMEHIDKLDVLHAKFDVLQSHLLSQEQAQEEFRMNLLAGRSDPEGKHAELQARVLDLETKAAGLAAGCPQDVEKLASRMEGIEKAIGDVANKTNEREDRVVESMQLATEAAGRVADVAKAIAQLTEENVSDRLSEVEHALGSSRSSRGRGDSDSGVVRTESSPSLHTQRDLWVITPHRHLRDIARRNYL